MSRYNWPLQRDIVTDADKMSMVQFLSKPNVRLTAGHNVRELEQRWSAWNHGSERDGLFLFPSKSRCARSLFVQSGSAANLLLFASLIEAGMLKTGARVALPRITWGTTLTPLILFGLQPVWIDVVPETLTMNMDQIRDCEYDFLWITHLAGMANPMRQIMDIAKDKGVMVAEDCCQAYGATVDGQKVGTFGIASTASFYFGHHMTTVEGGMLMWNGGTIGPDVVAASEAMRAHGLSREIRNPVQRETVECGSRGEIDDRFMFTHMPFNFRNTELNAVLGLEQLQRLDHIVEQRALNFHQFTNMLRESPKFEKRLTIPRESDGTRNSSFCLPFIFNTREDRDTFTRSCEETHLIETRPLAGGPLVSQPAFREHCVTADNEAAHDLYTRTVYIGNNHLVQADDWSLIHEVWKEAFGE